MQGACYVWDNNGSGLVREKHAYVYVLNAEYKDKKHACLLFSRLSTFASNT